MVEGVRPGVREGVRRVEVRVRWGVGVEGSADVAERCREVEGEVMMRRGGGLLVWLPGGGGETRSSRVSFASGRVGELMIDSRVIFNLISLAF